MQRRDVLKGAGVLPVALGLSRTNAARAQAVADPAPGWRHYEITTEVMLGGSGGPATLWLPLVQSAGDYQKAVDLTWQTNASQAHVVHDPVYCAGVLRVDWASQTGQALRMLQTVAVRDRGANGAPASREEQQLYLQPTPDMPLDGIVKATSDRIVAGRTSPEAKVRAIYDWVVDNCFRNPTTPGCGLGRIRTMLETHELGGKCADQSSLMVGLTRAAGIPAREVYGIRIDRSAQFPSLGAAGDITRAQHCRAEVYLDSRGWMAVDPADVRKAVLMEKLPLHDPRIIALRERAFGGWEMNWVGYNSARDFRLPGSTDTAEFLMYPRADTDSGSRDALQPQQFQYAISARRI
jgi:transglutaminase-like putative cysteine protease